MSFPYYLYIKVLINYYFYKSYIIYSDNRDCVWDFLVQPSGDQNLLNNSRFDLFLLETVSHLYLLVEPDSFYGTYATIIDNK